MLLAVVGFFFFFFFFGGGGGGASVGYISLFILNSLVIEVIAAHQSTVQKTELPSVL